MTILQLQQAGKDVSTLDDHVGKMGAWGSVAPVVLLGIAKNWHKWIGPEVEIQEPIQLHTSGHRALAVVCAVGRVVLTDLCSTVATELSWL